MNKNEIAELLRKGVVQIKFEKVDGTIRIMKCTLHPDLLPVRTETTQTRSENEHVVSAWNIDLQEWRSFRVDSVIRLLWFDAGEEKVWERTT